MTKNIGIIGCGNMGSAIARRIEGKYALWVCDKDASRLGDIAAEVLLAADLVQKCDLVILAVKPQDFPDIIKLINGVKARRNKLFISIAAGITSASIEKGLQNARVIRVMPNLPAQVGEGMTALSKGSFTTQEDLDNAEEIFSLLGKTIIVKEGMMNAVTAVSGSGPAYVCFSLEKKILPEIFLEQFEKAAQAVGFDAREAELLVHQTYQGTVALLEQKGITPEELRRRVTSKGGTTEAALKVLEKGGTLIDGVKAALERAKELSGGQIA